MNISAKLIVALNIFTIAYAHAATAPSSKNTVIESPDNVSVLRQPNAEAMYLYDTNNGLTILYIEKEGGKGLAALDVTDPEKIREVAEIELPAKSSFEFVREIDQENVLIGYRDGSGNAIINFKHYQRPLLVNSNQLLDNVEMEDLGKTAMLIRRDGKINLHKIDMQLYKLIDTTSPTSPRLLATIPGVEERLTKDDTGTLFLLNNRGVTVIRCLLLEEEHRIDRYAQGEN
jgi:hypothetical protein